MQTLLRSLAEYSAVIRGNAGTSGALPIFGLTACSDATAPQFNEKPSMQEAYPGEEEPIVGYSEGTNEYALFLAKYAEVQALVAQMPFENPPVEGSEEYTYAVNYKPSCLVILGRYLMKAQLTAFLLGSAWEARLVNKTAAYELALGAGLMAMEAYQDWKLYQQCRAE